MTQDVPLPDVPAPSPDAWCRSIVQGDRTAAAVLAVLLEQADADGALSMPQLTSGLLGLLPERDGRGEPGLRSQVAAEVLPRLAASGVVAPSASPVVSGDERVHLAPVLAALRPKERAEVAEGLRGLAERRRQPRLGEPVSVLSANGLIKTYRGRRVVNDVGLRVAQGEIVGLLGPNGAGKTTTFYMLVGLIAPEAGSISLDGNVITDTPMYQRARQGIGYLSQEPSVFRKLTVEENILAILETLPLTAEQRRERLEQLLQELSIGHLRRSKAYQLSGGERRRLEITRALVTQPKFMMLDEPFAGVDPIAVHDIQMIVAGLRHRGIGVLISDHNVEQTLDIVDRAYIMFDGQVKVSGTVRELVFDDTVAEIYLGPTLTARLRARFASADGDGEVASE